MKTHISIIILFLSTLVFSSKMNAQTWVKTGANKFQSKVQGITFDPNDTTGKKAYAAVATGGLWVNNDVTNATSAWTLVDNSWENMTVSSITFDPNDSQIIYVGTGDLRGQGPVGDGIWKSTDAGATWNKIFNQSPFYLSDLYVAGEYLITDIAIRDNAGSSELFVGVTSKRSADLWFGILSTGVYKSVDDGATFTRLEDFFVLEAAGGASLHNDVMQIEIGADNAVWVTTENSPFSGSADGGAIFKSTDGISFTRVYDVANGIGQIQEDRVQMAVSKTNANVAYALVEMNTAEGVKLIKTLDGGVSWFVSGPTFTDITIPTDAYNRINDFTGSPVNTNMVIEIDPEDDTTIYVGGINLFKSTDSGATWSQISKGPSHSNSGTDTSLTDLDVSLVRDEQNVIVFNPSNSDQIVFGNSGGVYFAADKNTIGTNTGIIEHNNGLTTTQLNSFAVHPTTGEMIGGVPEIGSLYIGNVVQNAPDGFAILNAADGGPVMFAENGEYFIFSGQRSQYYVHKYSDGSNTALTTRNFRLGSGETISDAVLDSNFNMVFANSNARDGNGNLVRKRIQRFSGFLDPSVDPDDQYEFFLFDAAAGGVSAISLSPLTTTSSTLFVGTNRGELFKVENANTGTRTDIPVQITTSLADWSSISDIKLGASEDEIFLTVDSYNSTRVIYSNDGGTTWANKFGNLPDMPIHKILVNPTNSDEVYIATERGLYHTDDFLAGPTWTRVASIPSVRVTELVYQENDLYVATYGAGVFKKEELFLSTDDVDFIDSIVSIYPNPAKEQITLQLKETLSNGKVKIYDLKGQLVFSDSLDSSMSHVIPLKLSSGLYITNILDNGNVIAVEKLIVK